MSDAEYKYWQNQLNYFIENQNSILQKSFIKFLFDEHVKLRERVEELQREPRFITLHMIDDELELEEGRTEVAVDINIDQIEHYGDVLYHGRVFVKGRSVGWDVQENRAEIAALIEGSK